MYAGLVPLEMRRQRQLEQENVRLNKLVAALLLDKEILPDVTIILGGPHPTMFPEYAMGLEGVDAICTGDGEDTFVEFVEA